MQFRSLRGLVHGDPRETEVAALEKVAPSILPMRLHILERMAEEGELGLTPDEYADQHNKLINTARRRFVDLWKGGEIRPTEMVRPNPRGNDCVVYVLGEDPEGMAQSAPKPSDKEIRQARALLKAHGIELGRITAHNRVDALKVAVEISTEALKLRAG